MSDFLRASLLEQEIIQLRMKYVKMCKRCNGKGRIYTSYYDPESLSFKSYPCVCYRKYIYIFDLLIAGVKEHKAVSIISQKAKECFVREVDLSDGRKLEKSKLYQDHLFKYAANIEKVLECGYSYVFIGVNSTGKTFAALKLLHHFLKMGKSGHYIKFRKLMKIINRTLSGHGQERTLADRLLDEILKVDLLVIDELGRETGNREHIASEVDEILKDRDMANLPTIVITNREFENIEDLYEGGNSAIISAFMRNYKLFIFDPRNDFRKQERKQIWFKQ
jgi:DNA replication protein DnaC